jgi:hypothetical protein
MNEQLKSFLSKSLCIIIILFIIRCFISKSYSLYGLLSNASEAITAALIIMAVYEKFLWRYNPLEKIPRLNKKYDGKIIYDYNGSHNEKEISIFINQTLLSTNIIIKTNEITSNTISSNLLFENGKYVLYYNYITNPKSQYSTQNPIQYGTCRLIVDEEIGMRGRYWTTQKTIGDIVLSGKIDAAP